MEKLNFRIAVKAFIIREGKVLVIRRRSTDAHKPGQWDIPGGRLALGENPLDGVKRESLEEVGLAVEPVMPLDVHHFTRDDGQLVTMIIFWCRSKTAEVKLSEEHQEFRWLDINTETDQFPQWLAPVIANTKRYLKYSSD